MAVTQMLVLNPDGYRHFLRPLLFRLPPEAAQQLADLALRPRRIWAAVAPALRVKSERLRVDLSGIELDSPVGLAAGYDKNCEHLPSLSAMGFGYLVGGTVTEEARKGNPRPRLLRYVEQESLINSLGFPSKGLEYAAQTLEQAWETRDRTPIVVSVSGVTVGEILRCHRRLEPLVDAVEVNISSPNTAGLRAFHERALLSELLGRINDQRQKPVFVKIPPYLATPDPDLPLTEPGGLAGGESEDTSRRRVFGLIRVCLDRGVDGLTVSNSRPALEPRLATGVGGLSGRGLFGDLIRMVREIRASVGDRLAINACGGIFSGEDAWQALKEGATTVQVLTALVYRGPGVVRQINRELLRVMDREGVVGLSPAVNQP